LAKAAPPKLDRAKAGSLRRTTRGAARPAPAGQAWPAKLERSESVDELAPQSLDSAGSIGLTRQPKHLENRG